MTYIPESDLLQTQTALNSQARLLGEEIEHMSMLSIREKEKDLERVSHRLRIMLEMIGILQGFVEQAKPQWRPAPWTGGTPK